MTFTQQLRSILASLTTVVPLPNGTTRIGIITQEDALAAIQQAILDCPEMKDEELWLGSDSSSVANLGAEDRNQLRASLREYFGGQNEGD